MSSKNHTIHSPLFPNSFFSPSTSSPSANQSLGINPTASNNKTPPTSNKTPLTTNMTNLTTSSFNNLTSSSFSVSSSISPNNNLSDVGTIPTQRPQAGLNSRSTASPSAAISDEDDMDEDTDDHEGQRDAQSPYIPYSAFPSPPTLQHQSSGQQQRGAAGTTEYIEPASKSPDMLLQVDDAPHDLAQLHAQGHGHEHFQTIPLSPARVKTAEQDEGNRERHQRHRSLQISSSGTDGALRQQHTAFSDANIYSSTREGSTKPIPSKRKSSFSVGNSKQQGSHLLDAAFSTASDDALVHQLPSLCQVLNRKTLPPVCLFNFYLYMRDFEKSSEEIDFWLDVTEHEVRWRRYARAAKRRMAIATQERLEREERDRLARSITESQLEEQERELENEKKNHRQQPSVTLDMYEPHWSAANRYLEMSDSGGAPTQDHDPTNGNNNSSSKMEAGSYHDYTYAHNTNHNANNHGYEDPRDTKEVLQEDPRASPYPKSPLDSSPTMGRVQLLHISGAVPDNWAHPDDSNNKRDQTPSLPDKDVKAANKNNAPSVQESITSSEGPALGTTVQRVATNTTIATRSTANTGMIRRGGTTGTASVTKDDLLRSAERIYYKYLIPQAESPVRIPSAVRHRVALFMDGLVLSAADTGSHAERSSASGAAGVGPSRKQSSSASPGAQRRKSNIGANSPASAPSAASLSASGSSPGSANEKSGSQQPQQQPEQGLGLVFSEARDMVFEGMESYYFPRFIKNRAYGNMWRSHRLARLVLGLFILFIGFTIMLSLIFLNVRPRSLRAWALIPIFLGIMLCTTFQFNLCPIMAALGVSETKWMQFAKIKEPYILSLHRKRALKVMVVALLYTACVGLVFGLVPGHRL
ncbi:Bud site selection protein, Revert to axial protein 1 [Mortierella alpina]|nr:Bud site selection protein, Revert to axial protein 1 [Mortierella alpina]